tara:strand:- start:307 stop:2625 length:2319 start_codon:yes stop_codon:yes gene_type:complete
MLPHDRSSRTLPTGRLADLLNLSAPAFTTRFAPETARSYRATVATLWNVLDRNIEDSLRQAGCFEHRGHKSREHSDCPGTPFGYVRPSQIERYASFVWGKGPQTYCEIGFNGGHGTVAMLAANPQLTVHSFDIGSFPYVEPAQKLVRSYFGDRFHPHLGDSVLEVPAIIRKQGPPGAPGHFQCDVVLVDGDHTRCGAHADIINMRQLSKTGTILLIDDLNEGPGAALWRVERDRLVEVLERHSFNETSRVGDADNPCIRRVRKPHWHCPKEWGWAVARYLDPCRDVPRSRLKRPGTWNCNAARSALQGTDSAPASALSAKDAATVSNAVADFQQLLTYRSECQAQPRQPLRAVDVHSSGLESLKSNAVAKQPQLLRRYYRSVYREQLEAISDTMLTQRHSQATWIYHVLDAPLRLTCAHSFYRSPPSVCAEAKRAQPGVGIVFCSPVKARAINWFGFFRPGFSGDCADGLRSREYVPDGGQVVALPPHQPEDHPPAFAPDDSWVEVIRVGTKTFSDTAEKSTRQTANASGSSTFGEGGAHGCWFLLARGSGIFLNVGRSIRANNRSHLMSTFGEPLNARELDGYSRNPWLENWHNPRARYCNLCRMARANGYDSIQFLDELCGNRASHASHKRKARHACFVEVVSCHDACMALPTKSLYGACVPGLPLRTGWDATQPCACDDAQTLLNCLHSAPELPPPTPTLAPTGEARVNDFQLFPAASLPFEGVVRRGCDRRPTPCPVGNDSMQLPTSWPHTQFARMAADALRAAAKNV